MEVRFLPPFVCVSVCSQSHDVSKIDASRITKLDVEMFHDESWKLNSFILGQKVKVTSHNNIAVVNLCTLVSAGFFQFHIISMRFKIIRYWSSALAPATTRSRKSSVIVSWVITACTVVQAVVKATRQSNGKGQILTPGAPKPLNGFRWNSEYIIGSRVWPHMQSHVALRQRGWSGRTREKTHVVVS